MRRLWLLGLVLLWGGCATPPPAPLRVAQPPQHAVAAQPTGAFVDLEAKIQAAHGAAASGFMLLDRNHDGLRWRLALIDSARHSIDLQYYTWFGDVSGRLLLKRVVDAADRGVKVRMLIDDLNTLLRDASTPQIRDGLVAAIDAHPNIEVRLFNPWTRRDLFGRAGEMVADLERLNQRMHNKQLVVDNRAAIIGGRNLGDEYLGLNPVFNFRDLDVLGIGPVARQGSAVFDSFWNSEWVLPVQALHVPLSEVESQPKRRQLDAALAAEPALAGWPIAPQAWGAEIEALAPQLRAGTSRVVSDLPQDGAIRHTMLDHAREFADGAQRELLVENAYIIPSQPHIDWLRTLTQRGVKVGIVTNSLASHDVPAVNSHYKKWRKPLLEAGVSLFEIRHDAAVQRELADTAPVRSGFMGLHVKAIAVDGKRVMVGSMNLDPRSADINSEMAVLVDSPPLAADVVALIRRDMQPENSWHVQLDDQGRLRWVHSGQTVTLQPARNAWQRVEDIIFMAFPREYY
jgi:putative cardiolipin synthase